MNQIHSITTEDKRRKFSDRDSDVSNLSPLSSQTILHYRGADKSLARPGRKQATATEEDFDVHISFLLS